MSGLPTALRLTVIPMYLFNASIILVGIACLAYGVIFIARRRARIFYGVNTEGRSAVVAGSVLCVVGVAVILFAVFVFPDLVDLQGIMEDVPEFRNR